MDFINSIPFPFQSCPTICQRLSLKYFLKKVLVLFSIILFILLAFICYTTFSPGRPDVYHDFRMAVIFFVLRFFPPVIAIIIYLESLIRRKSLEQFPIQIAFIDSIMRRQLCIDMKRDEEKSRTRCRLINWFVIMFGTFFSMTIYAFFHISTQSAGGTNSLTKVLLIVSVAYAIIVLPPFIVILLHFYRVVTFIDIVRYRYRLINDCLRNFHNFTNWDFHNKPDEIRVFLNSSKSFEKLRTIIRISRMLYTTSQCINDLFGWSLMVCIFFNFNCFYIIAYLLLAIDEFEWSVLVSVTFLWVFIIQYHWHPFASLHLMRFDHFFLILIEKISFVNYMCLLKTFSRQLRSVQICTLSIRWHAKDASRE